MSPVDANFIQLLLAVTPAIGDKVRQYLLERGDRVKVSELHALFLAQNLEQTQKLAEILENHIHNESETLSQIARCLRRLEGHWAESGLLNTR